MLAGFAVVPLGVADGVKELVAEALKIVDASGLDYELGAMGTTVEGEREQVMEVILACHERVLELAPRVLTNITLDERRGATGRLEGKVRDVEEILGKRLRRKSGAPPGGAAKK
ncbi:MAG: MTH1187 family thiamine-binding protein [Acidobacteriaceae bacterium]